jgi:predicted ATPase/DNA-binding SARP family transcriptional activator/Tfp pilus assembly protein PilF
LQALLAYLLLHRDAPQGRQYIAFQFWPDSTEAQAQSNLRNLLLSLRRSLPDLERYLTVSHRTLQWRDDSPFVLDVTQFEKALAEAGDTFHTTLEAPSTGEPAHSPSSVRALQRVVDLYTGDLLPGCYDEWILAPRERLRQGFLSALEMLIHALEQRGDLNTAILYGQRLVRHDPLREENYRHLMRLQLANGDRAGVVTVYRHCKRMLKRELGLEPSQATVEIARQAEELEASKGVGSQESGARSRKRGEHRLPTPDSRLLAPGNLPAQTTAFIGREREVLAVSELLRHPEVRLVTLTGAAGVGKTRLSVAAASAMASTNSPDRFPDGVWFVPLAPLVESDGVVSAIAQVFQIAESGGQSLLDSLLGFLHEKRTLLLLDNFEHLLPGGAPLVADLLAHCADVKVLVTSRAVLNLRGEHEHPVPPMITPGRDAPAQPDELVQYEAVALFAERALEVYHQFALTRENGRAVAEICRRLEGLPLAIELAAARVKVLSPEAILSRLDRRLKLLVGGKSDLPPRQRALETAIAWSYNLLDEAEKQLFRALSVFVGGCSLEAAEAVVGSQESGVGSRESDQRKPTPDSRLPTPLDVLETITSLLNKSLLVRTESTDDRPRFSMLETLREYAGERLVEKGEAEEIFKRHALYYVALAASAQDEIVGAGQALWLARLDQEHDNFRAALRWAIDRGNAEIALRLVGSLARFWEVRGYFNESLVWIKQALSLPWHSGNDSEQVRLANYRAVALTAAGLVAERQGKYDEARRLHTESLELYRAIDNKIGLANALNNLALLEAYFDYDLAVELHTQSLQIRRETGDMRGVGISLSNLGYICLHRQEYEQARAYEEEALAIHRKLGNNWGVVATLYMLGMTTLELGDWQAAVSLLEDGYALSKELDYKWMTARAASGLGQAFYLQQDYDRALAFFEEAEAIYIELGDQQGIATALIGIGREAHRKGELAEAARLYKRALDIGIDLNSGMVVGPGAGGLAGILSARGRYYDAARLFGVAQKALELSGYTLERYAMTLGLEECKAQLNAGAPGAWEAALAEGEAMPTEQAAALAQGVS